MIKRLILSSAIAFAHITPTTSVGWKYEDLDSLDRIAVANGCEPRSNPNSTVWYCGGAKPYRGPNAPPPLPPPKVEQYDDSDIRAIIAEIRARHRK